MSYICDCGRSFCDAAGIEACQMSNHGQQPNASLERETTDIQAALELVARHLPKGYALNISIENDGHDVSLEQPHGCSKRFDSETIAEQINDAIAFANGFID